QACRTRTTDGIQIQVAPDIRSSWTHVEQRRLFSGPHSSINSRAESPAAQRFGSALPQSRETATSRGLSASWILEATLRSISSTTIRLEEAHTSSLPVLRLSACTSHGILVTTVATKCATGSWLLSI